MSTTPSNRRIRVLNFYFVRLVQNTVVIVARVADVDFSGNWHTIYMRMNPIWNANRA